MSNYAKLIINGIEADSFSIQLIPLNLKNRISNADGETAGSFTRSTLNIPATKVNKAILDGVFGFLPFRIEINGAVRLSGLLQLKSANIKNNCYECTVDSYEVALFGGNSDWFFPLRDCTMDEITSEQVTFNEANILSGFNADPSLVNYGFSLIKWHEWQNSKVVAESQPLGGTINRQLETPSVFESTPFLFIKPLVVAAFNKVGYRINSAFLDSDFFERLILPVPLPAKMPVEYSEQFLNFDASLASLTLAIQPLTVSPIPYNVFNEPPQNPGVWSVVLFEYTAPESGFYEVEIGTTYGPQIGTFSFVYIQTVAINGLVVPISSGGVGYGDGGLLAPTLFPTGQTRFDSGVFQITAGDKISVRQSIFTDTAFDVNNSFVRIKGEAIRTDGLTIDFSTFLAKYNFLDMFRDLVKMFKLSIDTNTDNKTVLIEPSDLYKYTDRLTSTNETREGYYFTNDTIDYSRKIDFTQKTDLKFPVLDGFFDFLYSSDDGDTIAAIEENERFRIYEAIFSSPEGSDKNKTKTIETEFFAKTIHVRDNLARYTDTNIAPQFPLIYPFDYVLDPTATTSEANYDVSPRILYFGGQRAGIDGYIEIFETGLKTEVPAAFMVNYNDSSGLDPNLSWSAEVINGTSVPGLVERFYIQCLARLKQRENKTASVCLNSVERDNFTFRQRALINGKRYIIEYTESVNPLQGLPDRFFFVRDEFATQDCIDEIQNTNLTGVVSLFTIP
jgi:hypothetical protein